MDDTALLGASQYLETSFGLKVGMPPVVDFDKEKAVQSACREAIRDGLLDVAHDCSDGGLAVALAEMCIAGGVGAQVKLDEIHERHRHMRSDVILFSEDPSRIIVGIPQDKVGQLEGKAASLGARLVRLGVTGGNNVTFSREHRDVVDLLVTEIGAAWRDGLG